MEFHNCLEMAAKLTAGHFGPDRRRKQKNVIQLQETLSPLYNLNGFIIYYI